MKLEKQADLKRRRRSNASEVRYVLNYKIVLKKYFFAGKFMKYKHQERRNSKLKIQFKVTYSTH